MAHADPASGDLAGTVVIVTGGTRGLGRVIAQGFLAAGAKVEVCGRKPPPAPVASGTVSAGFTACDVREAAQARAFVDAVAERHGRLDTLINNAGGSPQALAASASPRFSEAILALNLLAPLYLSQAAHRWMSAQPTGGSIINIASISGTRPSPGTAIYGAAKAGLLNLTQSLAQEWGPRVRVNALIAGLMATETLEQTYGTAEQQARIADSLPMRRLGRGEDLAAAAMFLASTRAGYISGAHLSIDGGGEKPLFLEILRQPVAAA